MRNLNLSFAIFVGVVLTATQIFSAQALHAEGRSTKIDFEEVLVEGMNKQALDSLSHFSENDDKERFHLYRKRAGFRDLHNSLVEELRDSQ